MGGLACAGRDEQLHHVLIALPQAAAWHKAVLLVVPPFELRQLNCLNTATIPAVACLYAAISADGAFQSGPLYKPMAWRRLDDGGMALGPVVISMSFGS